jgi:L-ascorbate metabolism protein UlaG (beta-lactamase superfamily)
MEPTDDTITFIGTATTLLRLGRFTVLTDPNFLHRGQAAYLGKGLWSRRLTEPAVSPAQLPVLDAIVLSHLHGDHFDRVARAELARDAPVVTTRQAARRLSRWGFRAQSLETWETTSLESGDEELRIIALPAIHARGLMRPLLPPVMGTMLELSRQGRLVRRVYLSGDTLTGSHVSEIAARFPTIDTAVVHLGGTRVLFHTVTMDDVQGLDFADRTHPRQVVPVHHSDYPVFRSPLSSFVSRAQDAGWGDRLSLVAPGDSVALVPEATGSRRDGTLATDDPSPGT